MNIEYLSKLIDKNKSKEVVIITAGPSVNFLDRKSLNEFCKGKFVVAVKQTISLLDRCDIHVFNDDNFEKFDYQHLEYSPLTIYVKSASLYKRVPRKSYDVRYQIPREFSLKDLSLASTREFDRWSDLLNGNLRPYGPGIMYEFCIYIPVALSATKVHFFGWDIGSKDDNIIERFYQKKGLVSKINYLIMSWNLSIYNRFYIHCENLIRYIFFSVGFNTRINIPGVTHQEAVFIADSTEGLYQYYIDYGVEPIVYSQTSLLSKRFKRGKL